MSRSFALHFHRVTNCQALLSPPPSHSLTLSLTHSPSLSYGSRGSDDPFNFAPKFLNQVFPQCEENLRISLFHLALIPSSNFFILTFTRRVLTPPSHVSFTVFCRFYDNLYSHSLARAHFDAKPWTPPLFNLPGDVFRRNPPPLVLFSCVPPAYQLLHISYIYTLILAMLKLWFTFNSHVLYNFFSSL